MAVIYQFGAYRTNRFLSKFSEQTDQMSVDVSKWRGRISTVRQSLDDCVHSLETFDSDLTGYRRSCEKTGERNREFQKALEGGDIEELLDFRKKVGKSSLRR